MHARPCETFVCFLAFSLSLSLTHSLSLSQWIQTSLSHNTINADGVVALCKAIVLLVNLGELQYVARPSCRARDAFRRTAGALTQRGSARREICQRAGRSPPPGHGSLSGNDVGDEGAVVLANAFLSCSSLYAVTCVDRSRTWCPTPGGGAPLLTRVRVCLSTGLPFVGCSTDGAGLKVASLAMKEGRRWPMLSNWRRHSSSYGTEPSAQGRVHTEPCLLRIDRSSRLAAHTCSRRARMSALGLSQGRRQLDPA